MSARHLHGCLISSIETDRANTDHLTTASVYRSVKQGNPRLPHQPRHRTYAAMMLRRESLSSPTLHADADSLITDELTCHMKPCLLQNLNRPRIDVKRQVPLFSKRVHVSSMSMEQVCHGEPIPSRYATFYPASLMSGHMICMTQ